MATNELIERLRSKRPIDLETLSILLEEAADCIEGLEDRIAEKQKHLENLQKVNEDLEKRIATMSEGGYVPGWHFFKIRPATDEEKESYKVIYGEYNEGDAEELQMLENVPGDGEDVFLWNGYGFSVDTYDDGMLEREGEIEEGMAWAYLPEQPKGSEK